MSAVDEPAETARPGIEPAAPAEAPRRSLLFRSFRTIRKSLEGDGVVGRVRNHFVVTTLADLRLILFVLLNTLWLIEPYIAKYTASHWDRMMLESFGTPLKDGALARALKSDVMAEVEYYLRLSWILDCGLWFVYAVLEKFTLDDLDIAEREYNEARRQLGDAEVDDERHRPSLLAPVVDNKIFSWATTAAIGFVCLLALRQGYGVAVQVAQERADYAPEATPEELSRINPWRDLLPSQEGVLRELIYIGDVLKDLTPTTLPDDDYQLFSDLLRSLETRTDISWRVFEETEIRQPVLAASNRRTIPDEPFDINKRLRALHKYWDGLSVLPEKPARSEDASDTTFIPPILRGRQISNEDGGGSNQLQDTDASYKLTLTSEQDAEATKIYNRWRDDRDRKVSYLKLHPPTPMAWAPVSRSNAGTTNAWSEVFPDGKVGAGRHVASSKLVGNKKWKPLFRSLLTENIPFDWQAPGFPEVDWDKVLKESNERYERTMERRAKQTEYQEVLKAKLSERKVKEEL